MPLSIDIQNHVLVLTTSDGQIATIDTSVRAFSVQQTIAQWVLEVAALIEGEGVEILHLNGEGPG